MPWFNDACKQATKERKKVQRELFQDLFVENVLAFKQQKLEQDIESKGQKQTSRQNFCSLLNLKTKSKTVWKAIRKIKREKEISLLLSHLKLNGKRITDKK